jgi:hypothetical protein
VRPRLFSEGGGFKLDPVAIGDRDNNVIAGRCTDSFRVADQSDTIRATLYKAPRCRSPENSSSTVR